MIYKVESSEIYKEHRTNNVKIYKLEQCIENYEKNNLPYQLEVTKNKNKYIESLLEFQNINHINKKQLNIGFIGMSLAVGSLFLYGDGRKK